jgi:hypothetical protein
MTYALHIMITIAMSIPVTLGYNLGGYGDALEAILEKKDEFLLSVNTALNAAPI